MQRLPRENGYKLPEYPEMAEVNTLIAAPPQPKSQAGHAETVAAPTSGCPRPWPWRPGTCTSIQTGPPWSSGRARGTRPGWSRSIQSCKLR